jgi:creatinine amidohydrolase
MKYAHLTSPELGQLAPSLMAVLPLGALEQHGPHLPVITDAAIAEELARRVDEVMPADVAVLPTIWCGSSHHHLGFPGTVSVRSSVLVDTLTDIIVCLKHTGFRRIFLLNGHGGNQTPFAEALYRVNLAYRGPDEPWVAAASYWNLAARELAEQTFMETPRLSHACEYETSLMLALRSDWVREPRAGAVVDFGSRFYDPSGMSLSSVFVCQSFDQMTPNGALGAPEKASVEKGRELFALLTEALVRFLREFAQWKRAPFGQNGRSCT